jgi:hypothetical protein
MALLYLQITFDKDEIHQFNSSDSIIKIVESARIGLGGGESYQDFELRVELCTQTDCLRNLCVIFMILTTVPAEGQNKAQ